MVAPALTTYTATTFNNVAKYLHAGNITVDGTFQWTAAGTVGDVFYLAKVPHGAHIVDFYEYHTSGQTAAAISFGFDRGIAAGGAGNASVLLSSGAIATMNRFSLATAPTPGGINISVSDSDPLRYGALICKAESGTFTTTVSGGWSLTYRIDGPERV